VARLAVAATPTIGATSPSLTATATPAVSSTPTATATAVPPLAYAKEVQQIATGFMSGITWTIVALLLPVIFWRSFSKLLRGLAAAMETRGFAFDLPGFKVTVSELPLDVSIDQTRLYSPFDLEVALDDKPSDLGQIEPQKAYDLTDRVAVYWTMSPEHRDKAHNLKVGFKALGDKLDSASSWENIREETLQYAKNLEAARFLKAGNFVELLERRAGWLKDRLCELKTDKLESDRDNFLIFFAAGIAYAQKGKWEDAKPFVEKISFASDSTPRYHPAGGAWLATEYHIHAKQVFDKTPSLTVDSSDFVGPVNALLEKANTIEIAMTAIPDAQTWSERFGVSKDNSHYYKRELWKAIGFINSFLGDYSQDRAKKETYLSQGEEYLSRCAQTNNDNKDDPPSPLDFNNFADMLRERGRNRLAQATETINLALKLARAPDPHFYNTQAQIFWKKDEPFRAILALQQYGAPEAEAEVAKGGRGDVEQYLRNQILAARYAANTPGSARVLCISAAADLLKNTWAFVDRNKKRLEKLGIKDLTQIEAEILELLGYLYLDLSGKEQPAVEAFDRLEELKARAVSEVTWRRELGRAKAYTHLARQERRRSSSKAAQQYWEAANSILSSEGVEKFVNAQSSQKALDFKLRLDTVAALQALAEESYCERRGDATQELLKEEHKILGTLRTGVENDRQLQDALDREIDPVTEQPVKGALEKMRSRVRLYEAHESFLSGRLAIRNPKDPEALITMRESFEVARGVNSELDCRIDLQLGIALLQASQTAKSNIRELYDEAVAALERAVQYNVPELRTETIAALRDAYDRRNSILSKARDSAKAS